LVAAPQMAAVKVARCRIGGGRLLSSLILLVFGWGCADDDSGANVERVACGSEVEPGHPCCPVSWKANGRCTSELAPEGCWTVCIANALPRDDEDAGLGLRSQMVCQSDGRIGIGLGLFPCDP
jgi:hypothetical protein